MAKVYLDTGALIKLYICELGSAARISPICTLRNFFVALSISSMSPQPNRAVPTCL